MNNTTNPPGDTGPGMTHEQCQRFETALKRGRDRAAAKVADAKNWAVEATNQYARDAYTEALWDLHFSSDGRYGEPYTPEAGGRTGG